MALSIILFLIINFAALALGGMFTKSGVPSDWYQNLNKAPWTPPGWVFGAAWSFIMLLFSVYMAIWWNNESKKNILLFMFILQWILNTGWNPIFFHFHFLWAGFVVIVALLIITVVLLFLNYQNLGLSSLLILPYILWLIVASSLNLYIIIKN
jgi:translocator protein